MVCTILFLVYYYWLRDTRLSVEFRIIFSPISNHLKTKNVVVLGEVQARIHALKEGFLLRAAPQWPQKLHFLFPK